MQLRERSERLREAVHQAGGQRAVSQKTGMPMSTLGNYLSGQDMKLSQVVELANATGVRLEWLAQGQGPMRAGFAETAPADPLAAQPASARAPAQTARAADFGVLEWLKSAIESAGGAAQAAARAGIPAESARELLAGRAAPAADLQALITRFSPPPTPPAPTSDSIWRDLDFETLVICLEMQEDLDRLGGGQLKSARSRLRRALNAYDITRNDKE